MKVRGANASRTFFSELASVWVGNQFWAGGMRAFHPKPT